MYSEGTKWFPQDTETCTGGADTFSEGAEMYLEGTEWFPLGVEMCTEGTEIIPA